MIRASLFFLILSTLSFAAAPAKQPVAPAKPPVAETKKPLNLAELSAKDTASFETYSHRIAQVQDSILATQKEIENARKKTAKQMPALKPKGEYEKKAEFDDRKAKWEKELDEKTAANSKILTDRLSELEIAKKHIEENQNSLYCTIDILTTPEAASIYLNKEEIGASPAEYKLALPGYTVIRIQKENYYPWDTTLTLQAAQKLKLNIALQERSIFSEEGEINFPKTLAKDTTIGGYQQRILRVKARIAQIDYEIREIFEDFPNKYAPLEPIKPEETLQDFERRKSSWQYEGERQVRALKDKYNAYRAKLVRSVETLEDHIIATEIWLTTEPRPNAKITLGNYDAEKEIFDIEVQDTANAKSPFLFSGKVGIPRDTAKAMNKSTDGFLAGVSYINYPFISHNSPYNLAMKELSLSRKAVPLKVEGSFKSIGKFETMEGYNQWHARKDSLLSGVLKAQGLDLNYALKGEKPAMATAAAVAATETSSTSEGGGGLSWRGWTRIVTFAAAAGLGAGALVMNDKASKNKKKFNDIMDDRPKPESPLYNKTTYDNWYNENITDLKNRRKDVKEYENIRTGLSAGAGVFAVAGILTFIF